MRKIIRLISRVIIVTVPFLIFSIHGCMHPTEPIMTPSIREYAAFAMDLQNGFQGDTVLIQIDNQLFYERATTTNPTNGFAFRIVPAVSAGSHKILVAVPNLRVQKDTTLNVQDTLAIGISFNRNKNQLFFKVYSILPTYGNCGGIDPLIVPRPPYDSPIWHPSGKFIGFNHTPLRAVMYPNPCYPQQAADYNLTGFWLFNVDGTNLRRIFPYTLLSPAWSPDGNWIAFCMPMGDEVQTFKMRFTGATFDTTTMVQLTSEGRNFFPAWSPDGQWIAYDSNNKSPNGMNFIWIMKFDGTLKERIAYTPSIGEIREPNYSPDGQFIVHQRYVNNATGSPEIFIMDTFGNNLKQLTFNQVDPYLRDNRNPRYSPNGTTIAFWSNANLWKMDSIGNNVQQLSTQGVDVSLGLPFSWSPDGSKIVYTRYQSTDWTTNNGVLWMIDVASKKETQFTFNP